MERTYRELSATISLEQSRIDAEIARLQRAILTAETATPLSPVPITASTPVISAKQDEPMDSQHVGVGPSDNPRPNSDNFGSDSDRMHEMHLLERVSIPIFKGDKHAYEAWKAAFMACIDRVNIPKEHKLLRLQASLQGEPLKTVQKFGYSAAAYEKSLSVLDRKYGGQRRRVMMYLEEMEQFKPMSRGSMHTEKELDKFADLLDALIINLQVTGNDIELHSQSLYLLCQKKLSSDLLIKYQEWVHGRNMTPDILALKNFVEEQLEYLTVTNETMKGISGARSQSYNAKTFLTEQDEKKQHRKEDKTDDKRCAVCNGSHDVWKCDSFKQMSVDERWEKAKELRMCFRCLNVRSHQARDCRRGKECGIDGCRSTHNRLLHSQAKKPKEGERPQSSSTNTMFADSTFKTEDSTKSTQSVAMRTIPVYVHGNGKRIKVNALLDEASSRSYIEENLAHELGLTMASAGEVRVTVLSGQKTLNADIVTFQLSSISGSMWADVTAYSAKNIVGQMKPVKWNIEKKGWPHLRDIKFPFVDGNKVEVLLGLDQLDLLYSIQEIRGKPGEPVARLTPLGWTCVGPVANAEPATHFTFFSDDLEDLVKKFWEIEEPILNSIEGPEDQECHAMKVAQKTLTKDQGRYHIGIPWKPDRRSSMPDSYNAAMKRLESTEKNLMKNPEVKETYREIIRTYEEKGYIRKVSESSDSDEVWYLPHFPVVRKDKATTKTRIVFDASMTVNGVSLNTEICDTPKLQNDLADILLQFRRDNIAIVCDVQEMYLQIGMKEEDKKYHRFLWREDMQREPNVYEFQRVVFGVKSSPFLAQYVTQEHARRYQSSHPLAAEAILKSTYMDDTMVSVSSSELGSQFYRELSDLLSNAGMVARKWISNSSEVMQDIPHGSTVAAVSLDPLPNTKTLGVMWVPREDMFTFHVNIPEIPVVSKRKFLSKTATLFDPLGLLSPSTILARMILQEVWCAGVDWDDPLPHNLQEKTQKWFKELSALKQVQIPRSLKSPEESQGVELHVFCDASEVAYGACVYVKHECADGTVTSRLAAAKAKVVPLKAISVPRLELMAAIVGVRLGQKVGTVLNIPAKDWVFWSDSMDVLHWIKGSSRKYKPFVGNRVSEIQETTQPSQWRHVPSAQNPADILSRGRHMTDLIKSDKWWEGPDYLRESKSEWPETKLAPQVAGKQEVRKKYKGDEFVFTTSTVSADSSSWIRLLRVGAWIQRFVSNCQLKKADRTTGPLRPDEIEDEEIKQIRQCQQETFPEVKDLQSGKPISKTSKLVLLNPQLDEDGVMRCRGRLEYAESLSWNARNPVILPKQHAVTRLIVKYYHEKCRHGGTNQTLAQLSHKFWIIAAREAIREWERQCMICKRNKTMPYIQMMAPLPSVRSEQTLKAFSNIAVDFAGPFLTKQGRGKTRYKRYLCLFTCLSTRAVHLELAYSLDTDSFINAFQRMVARRGMPSHVYSDNGRNFVGAQKELFDHRKVQDSSAHEGVMWHFNPPIGPHFGGVHEIMIKAAKKAIRAVLGDADITDEQLLTAIVGAEGLINSRPLTYQSANSDDVIPLTPNHFLHGQIGGQFAPELDRLTSLRSRWRRVQDLIAHFWTRWLREWLPSLQPRSKWRSGHKLIEEGDIVVIMCTDTPRGKWPLGRIVKTYPGKDGIVRVVDVKIKDNVMRRPVAKLCPLECD